MEHHTIDPVYDSNSRILILGSFPSVKSREAQFFYAHPQNRFWKVLAAVLGCAVPETVEEKRRMLLGNGIALWDVIDSCTIRGSSDSSITDVTPNDIARILQSADIRAILCNGTKSYELYCRYLYPQYRREAVKLPSTSPANAAWSMERLVEAWGNKIKCFL